MIVFKELIKKWLYQFGCMIQQLATGRSKVIPLWYYDDTFNNLMKQVTGHTLVDRVRCFVIYQYSKQVAGLSGDVAEVGVYKGGTARLLSKAFESEDNKTIHLFDTFSGMPPADSEKDLHREGDFDDTSVERVKKYMSDCNNVLFYQGQFPMTSTPVENTTFCLVHIDVDIYKSVIECCKFFYPRMEKGGVMIFDDYGFMSCPGAKKAVDEFFLDKPENPCYLPTGQCIVMRIEI